MRVVVVEPPEPVVTPEAIPGSHGTNDPFVASLIRAATEEIDGPTGWLGRALGPQTLELRTGCFSYELARLPYPPLIQVLQVSYLDRLGVETVLDPTLYSLPGRGIDLPWGGSWPFTRPDDEAVRVRYRAGYDGLKTGTGPVPERARQAIILAVRHLMAVGAENLFLRSEEVEGIGSKQFTVSEAAGKVIRETTERLLQGLRVYS